MTENALTNGAPNADGADAPTEAEIPVQTGSPEPLQVAKEDAVADTGTAENAGAEDSDGDTPPAAPRPQKVPDWVQRKIAESAHAEREAKREAKRLSDELAALKAKPVAADAEAVRAEGAEPDARFGGYRTQADFDAAVQAEADRRTALEVAQRDANAFNERCNTVYSAGKGAYEDFDTAVGNLTAVGAMNREILDVVLETDDPHRVLYELGSDPDRAAAIMRMSIPKRAIELAKLAVVPGAAKKPAAADVSGAPPPVRPVEGTARVSPDLRDDDDDQTWFAKREQQLAARAAR